MRRLRRGLLAAVLLGLAAVPVEAAAGVRGVVRTIQRPLAGAHVVIPEAARFSVTDSLGRFDLGTLAPGLYGLSIAAVGYETAGGTVTVRGDSSSDASDWLLKPLRPDGGGLGSFRRTPPPPPGMPAGERLPQPLLRAPSNTRYADSLLADSLLRLPGPAPIAPPTGLFLTPEERASISLMPGALAELLPRIAAADSTTFAAGGTGAPGYESWRQWSERIAPLAAEPVAASGVTARRALAYTRTRAALAEGATWSGWQASKLARGALALARRDTARGRAGEAFLDLIEGRLDATFVAGQEPPKPRPVPPPKAARRRRHR
ncbi:MAG: carboxypeptidase regulatory-like domain-containing protein [Candidatus Eisenbacteria bacterium]